jgi:pyruvate,water dikinase
MTSPDTVNDSVTVDAAPAKRRGFPDPYEVPDAEGAADWRDLFAYHNVFNEVRREKDSARTWFLNGMHFPEPMYPFDMLTADNAFMSTGVMNTRYFALPPALGLDVRVLNGYLYMSANSVESPAEQERRGAEFAVRAGYYFQNWPALYDAWVVKIRAAIDELAAITFPEFGDFEPVDMVLAGRGITTVNDLLVAYNQLLASNHAAWNLHSELLNMGYAAYLNFLMLCRAEFPEISDQSVAQMVSGVDVMVLKPDEMLKTLAARGIELGIGDVLQRGGTADELQAELSGSEAGATWWAELQEAKEPWFHFSYGNGFYHHHRSWSDDLSFPLTMIGEYVTRLEAGEDLSRPVEAIARARDETVERYRSLIQDDDTRKAFDEGLGLSRTVFPFVENHNFYVEHWYHTVFWNKVRELSALFVRFNFFDDIEDIFFLRRAEVMDALVDLQMSWSGGGDAQGPTYWPDIIAARKLTHDALRAWSPPPALGPAPSAIVEPMTIMLWGITDEQVEKWLVAQEGGTANLQLSGFAGSPGIAEGPARVVLRADQLDELLEGEILVAPTTSPSWTPVFARIKGAVSDIGGIMCHAAIVCREYGLPAVVGTGFATTTIKTGQRIRVDGNTGVVTLLDD